MPVLFVNNLTNIDFSYLDAKRGLVGESWLVDIEIEGLQDSQGMIVDFGIVKSTVRNTVHAMLDHLLVVPAHSHQLNKHSRQDTSAIKWSFAPEDGRQIDIQAPRKAISFLPLMEITPETTAAHISSELVKKLPGEVQTIKLRFHSEDVGDNFYQYSHGLKKHHGACQRIAHGHRSKIEVFINDNKSTTLEKEICELLRDIYIGSREDLVKTFSNNGVEYFKLAYTSEEGQSVISIPASCCHLIDADTTVENIAEHLLALFKEKHPEDKLSIKAYEGISKGSIATA